MSDFKEENSLPEEQTTEVQSAHFFNDKFHLSHDSINSQEISIEEDEVEDISINDFSQTERNIEISDGLYTSYDEDFNSKINPVLVSQISASNQNNKDGAQAEQKRAARQGTNDELSEIRRKTDCLFAEVHKLNPLAIFFILDLVMAPLTAIILIMTPRNVLLLLLVCLQCASSVVSVLFLLPSAIIIMSHKKFKKLQYFWTIPAAMILVGRFAIIGVMQGFWFDNNWKNSSTESIHLLILIVFSIYGIGNLGCVLFLFFRCFFVITKKIIHFQKQTLDSEIEEESTHSDENIQEESEINSIFSPFPGSRKKKYSHRSEIRETPTTISVESNLGEDVESQFHV